jgi:hypothetical protein
VVETCCASSPRTIWSCAQDHLELRAVREARRDDVADADGVARGAVEADPARKLDLIFGEVEVRRLAYRQRGHANLYPADAELNLPAEKHSHGLRRLAALEAMKRKRGDAYPRLFDDDDGAFVEIRRERAKVLEKQAGLLAGASAGPSTEQDHRGFGGRSVSQQVAEVGVSGDDDALVQTRMVEDGLIGGIKRDCRLYMDRVVASIDQSLRQPRREACVHQEPHPALRSGSSRSRTASAAYCSP